MTEHQPGRALRWAWFALAVTTLLVIAHMTRYVPEGDGYFWDRWKHRECEAVAGGLDCAVPGETAAQAVGAGRS